MRSASEDNANTLLHDAQLISLDVDEAGALLVFDGGRTVSAVGVTRFAADVHTGELPARYRRLGVVLDATHTRAADGDVLELRMMDGTRVVLEAARIALEDASSSRG